MKIIPKINSFFPRKSKRTKLISLLCFLGFILWPLTFNRSVTNLLSFKVALLVISLAIIYILFEKKEPSKPALPLIFFFIGATILAGLLALLYDFNWGSAAFISLVIFTWGLIIYRYT